MSACVDKKIDASGLADHENIDQIRSAMNALASASKNADIQRVNEETSTIMGSLDADQSVKDKMLNGTYKRLTDKSAILSLIDDSFGEKLIQEMLASHKAGIPLTDEYLQHSLGFINQVKAALQQSTAKDIKHRFEVYDTDNEFTTAFWGGDINATVDETGNVDNGMIVVLNGKNGSTISNNAELLLHEFTHSATESAMRTDGQLNRKVAKLQKEVMKQLGIGDLLAHIENPTQAEQRRAYEILRYMNGDPSEFLAYAVSNPWVYEAMKDMRIKSDTFQVDESKGNAFTAVIDKMKEFLNKIISVITNGPTASHMLSSTLGELIARNMQLKTKVYTGETFDDYDAKVTGGKFAKVDQFMKDGSAKIEQRLKALSEMSPQNKKHLRDFTNMIGEIKYIRDVRESGVFQSIMHTMFRQTTDKDFAAAFQLIRKVKTENDKEQNSLKEINANLVHSWFKDIPANQRLAITDILAIDPQALGNVSKEYIAELMVNKDLLDEQIAVTAREINVDEYLNQARDLGWYMIHGTSKNPLLQTNAYRIYYRMYNGEKQKGLGEGTDSQMIHAIDKLATLYAIKYVDDRNKMLIHQLVNNKKALGKSSDVTSLEQVHIVDLALNLYNQSREDEIGQFKSYSNLLDKGYLRKAYKREMKAKIVPENLLTEMVKRGYGDSSKIHGGAIFSKAATDMRNDGMRYYMMYAPDFSVSRTQGAIHDIGYFDKVQQMKDIYDGDDARFEENTVLVRDRIDANREYTGLHKRFKDMSADEMESREDHLMPVIKLDGTIIDYSVPIGRSDAENHMELDRDIASVLAATVTHRSAKVKAIKGNISVVEFLLQDGDKHKDDPDYVVLRKSTAAEKKAGISYKYDKQWAMIPEYTRDYIYSRRKALGLSGDPESIMIHKDMVDDFIGYKDPSLANLQIGENGRYFNMQNHPIAALRVEQLQYIIKKLIARYKTVLVILNPDTVLGNAWSNFNMAMVHGIGPIEYMKLFTKHWKNLDDYNEMHNELTKLESEKAAGLRGLDNRIAALKKRLETNSMHELMKDGQFNMIIEDVDSHNNKEDHVAYYKRKAVEKIVGSKGASRVKDVAENVVLTKDSGSFKAIEKLTAYNDIINRAIVRDKMLFELHQDIEAGIVNKDLKAEKEREILNYIDQLFVNYSYLDNKYIKYANDVGLLLFTKYLFRALKTMKQVYDKKPLALTSFLALDNSGILPFDLEDPYANYFSPGAAIANRVGPVASLDFMEMAKKILMPGSFNII